eukprot:8573213-Lingulodinium_polyedra.AAC.1
MQSSFAPFRAHGTLHVPRMQPDRSHAVNAVPGSTDLPRLQPHKEGLAALQVEACGCAGGPAPALHDGFH